MKSFTHSSKAIRASAARLTPSKTCPTQTSISARPMRCASRSSTPFLSRSYSARTRPQIRQPARLMTSSRGYSCSNCSCQAAVKRATTAYIALGSNLGDRVAEIEKACRMMDERGIRVKRTSSLYETEPMYVVDQDRFLNGACEVETDLGPLELLDQLQAIENEMGRHKVIDKGPRNIDLDILLYGDQEFKHERLNVPHVGMREREFVLRPLAEIAPHKPIDPSKPWRLVQDYLNELPLGEPLSSITPISSSGASLTPLVSSRKTQVMAILNLTPDSFSDGGRHTFENFEGTLRRLIENGTSIIDIGGQSTAPGREQVSAEEEASRILPAIEYIRSVPEARGISISIDTYRASVAEKAIGMGADIINDVSAGLMDPDMLSAVGRLGKTICLMHMRGTPLTMDSLNSYPDGLIPTVASELLSRVAAAEAAGIRRWRIILDPGIGFAKNGSQNLEILRRLDELRHWPGLEGLPWLLGSSRKKFVGRITGVEKPAERVWGTAATVAAAIQGGADVVRVHDSQEMGMVAKMSDAIWRV